MLDAVQSLRILRGWIQDGTATTGQAVALIDELIADTKPLVIFKREIGELPKDTVVWVEVRDTIDDYKLNVECYQGVREHINPDTGGYELYIEYLCGQDTVAEYGKEYRFWTQRPTWDDMVNARWEVKSDD